MDDMYISIHIEGLKAGESKWAFKQFLVIYNKAADDLNAWIPGWNAKWEEQYPDEKFAITHEAEYTREYAQKMKNLYSKYSRMYGRKRLKRRQLVFKVYSDASNDACVESY